MPTPGRHIDSVGGVNIIEVGEMSLSANIFYPPGRREIFGHVFHN